MNAVQTQRITEKIDRLNEDGLNQLQQSKSFLYMTAEQREHVRERIAQYSIENELNLLVTNGKIER